MISTGLTPVQSSNSPRVAWSRLLALLGLVLLASACSKDPTGIGVGLPTANADTGAYLIDTVTVRASTVLRDSVVTSASSYLLVGRYTDRLLGTLQAKSYFRLGLGASFAPDPTYVYDSVALVLKASSPSYRYGDTTKTQTLVAVYPMTGDGVSNTKPSFASPQLTPLTYDASQRLDSGRIVERRARPNLTTLRLRLRNSFGRRLLAAGKARLLNTQDDFYAYLKGLAITGADNDNAALVGLSATNTEAGLYLYYHDPADATTPISTLFTIADGGAHCFQVTANRVGSEIGEPNFPKQLSEPVPSARTGERALVEGALGLQTKLEFPYLRNLNQLGQYLTITSAQVIAEAPATTLTPYIPAPPSLNVYLANINNQPIASYLSGANSVAYQPGISTFTGLDQGSYTFTLTSYVQGVLNNTVANNGLLLSSVTPELPSRVAIGSSRNSLNRLRFRIYVISVK